MSDTVAALFLPSDVMIRTVANMDGRFQSSLDACLALSESIWELDWHTDRSESYDNDSRILSELGMGVRLSRDEELARLRGALRNQLTAAQQATPTVVQRLRQANPTGGVKSSGQTKRSHAELLIAIAESRFSDPLARKLRIQIRPLPFDRQAIEVGLRNEHERAGIETRNDNSAVRRLLSVYTNGIADERIEKASSVLANDSLNSNDKLTKIDELMSFPATASAKQLGEMLGVTKQAVLQGKWWADNRKGEKDSEIGRRHEKLCERSKQYQPNQTDKKDD